MPSTGLVAYILAANALWDAVTGAGLLAFGLTGRCRAVADAHLCLWLDETTKTDSTLSSLSGFIVLQWGIVRAFAAADPTGGRWPDAASRPWR